MKKETKIELLEAIKSGNFFNLYDALADNGFESEEVYDAPSTVAWLISHSAGLLIDDMKMD